jgi:hypothetical protein
MARTWCASLKPADGRVDAVGVPAGARINRALWAFRATFALIALVLLAVIVRPAAFRAAPAATPPPATAHGRTAQGVAMAMSFDGRDRPVSFSTRLHARCVNPSREGSWPWDWGWWPVAGGRVRFDRDGRALRVVQVDTHTFDDGVFGQVVLSMRATVAPPGKAVRGWVRMSATFFYAVGTTTCESGRVPFAVGPTSARPS